MTCTEKQPASSPCRPTTLLSPLEVVILAAASTGKLQQRDEERMLGLHEPSKLEREEDFTGTEGKAQKAHVSVFP